MIGRTTFTALTLALATLTAGTATPAIAQDGSGNTPESFTCSVDLRGSGLSREEIYQICREWDSYNYRTTGGGYETTKKTDCTYTGYSCRYPEVDRTNPY